MRCQIRGWLQTSLVIILFLHNIIVVIAQHVRVRPGHIIDLQVKLANLGTDPRVDSGVLSTGDAIATSYNMASLRETLSQYRAGYDWSYSATLVTPSDTGVVLYR